VYSYNPYSSELSDEEMKYIIGVQGNLWTEYMPNSDHVEYMAYPRACAISEVGWLDFEKRDFELFSSRLQSHFKRLDILGVNYFNKILMPSASVEKVEFLEKETLVLKNNAIGVKLYYTMDGSTPSQNSLVYTQAISIDQEGAIKAVAINEKGEKSDVLEIKAEKLHYMEGTSTPGNAKGLKCKLVVGKFNECKAVEEAKGSYFQVSDIAIPTNAPQDNFGLVFEGLVNIPADGLYKFRLGSDDGSMLFLNNQVVIDNDGYHGMEYKKASLALRAGTYPVKLIYFEATGGENLKLSVVAPDGERINEFTEFLSY